MEWLRSRLGFLQYLSLHITLSLLLSFIFLGVFAKLSEEVLEQESLVTLDTLITQSFHANATPLATRFFLAMTLFGYEILWLVVILFCIYFIYKRQWMPMLILLVSVQGGLSLNSALKLFFSRPRPSFDDPIITALNHSFPSGHAMLSFITYGLLAYYLATKTPIFSRKLLIITFAAFLIGLIGLSRIYLGVHYLSDVIAGFAAGGFWLSTCITALYYIRHRRKKEPIKETA